MERRELLSPGGIAAIAGAFACTAEMPVQKDGPAGRKRVLRVYFDTDGSSQIEELPIATRPGRHAIHAGDVAAWARGAT